MLEIKEPNLKVVHENVEVALGVASFSCFSSHHVLLRGLGELAASDVIILILENFQIHS